MYLDLLAAVEGQELAIDAGLKAVAASPRLFGLKTRLSHWSVDLGRTDDAFRLTREFISENPCDHCKARASAELARWFLKEGEVENARRALALNCGADTGEGLDALRLLISRRKEGERSSRIVDLQDALLLYETPQNIPRWLLKYAACRLSHAPSHEMRAWSLINRERSRRRAGGGHSTRLLDRGLGCLVGERGCGDEQEGEAALHARL